MKLKLSTRFLLWLLAVASIAIVATQVLIYQISRRSLDRQIAALTQSQQKLLEEREHANAQTIADSIRRGVNDSLERGEMEKFSRLLEELSGINGLKHYSLYDQAGTVTYATERGEIGASLDPAAVEEVLRAGRPLFRRSGDEFQIYTPVPIVPDCRRCHHDWPETGISGAHFVAYSTSSLESSREAIARDAGGIRQSNRAGLILSLAVLLPVLAAVSWILIRVLINRPLSKAIASICRGVEGATGGAASLTAASQQLASGASEQAASLEEISASLEEMTSMTKRNADSAGVGQTCAQQSRTTAEGGVAEMGRMQAAIDGIVRSSGEIGKINKSIDEIAFQTSILSLNAAVEAARAGQAGAGFAVVAEEVRALAHRAAVAAREVSDKIALAGATSAEGAACSGRVAESLRQIVAKAREVDTHVADVAVASREQTEGLGQISNALAQLDKVTQSNAAASEETAATAEDLKGQVEILRSVAVELASLVGTRIGASSPALASATPGLPNPASPPSNHRTRP